MFDHYFHDDLQDFRDTLAARPPAGVTLTPGAALCDVNALAERIACFSDDRGCRDARAAASQWSKWVFSRLIIPVVVVQLATDQRLVCDWHELSIGWYADATPRCFVLHSDKFVGGEGAGLTGLIDHLLCPLVNALTDYSRLSPRVFWSNAAIYYDWVIGEAARQRRMAPARIAIARALLDARSRPDGGFNPFDRAYKGCPSGALDGNDTPVTRCRRLCCVRDLDPGWDLCANCPRAVHFDRRPRAASGG